MSPHRRLRWIARGVVLLAGTFAAHAVSRTTPALFSPLSLQAPPQRANGDFDGDGRVDSALIQDSEGERRISIHLSASSSVIQLDASVIGVVEGDIDHDGDLDLVASTLSGEILIWLNDGRGRFTQQPASRVPDLSAEPVLVQADGPESVAIGSSAPFVHSQARAHTSVVVTKARPPSVLFPPHAHSLILPLLRAPPAFSV